MEVEPQLTKAEPHFSKLPFKYCTQFFTCAYMPLLSKCNGFSVTVNWKVQSENPFSSMCKFFLSSKLRNELYGKILLPLQWCCAALHPFPHSLPAGNQIASLTTNDLERHIFWCHLVLSFLAFILMWLVAQESLVQSCQIMNCKTMGEKEDKRQRRKKAWFDLKILMYWEKICNYHEMMFFKSSRSGRTDIKKDSWKAWFCTFSQSRVRRLGKVKAAVLNILMNIRLTINRKKPHIVKLT